MKNKIQNVNIKVRKPNFIFKEDLPKDWVNDNLFKSHFGNTLTLLFPGAEKFFVRSIKKYIPPENNLLKKEILGFIGQETQHSIQHEKLWAILKTQGYEIDKFLDFFNYFAFEIIEKNLSDEMKISITSGLEHFTSMLAEMALEGKAFEEAEVEMKDLFEWHCIEELEHKSVAFNVLNQTNPDYLLRLNGLILATILFLKFSTEGVIFFAIQDNKLFDLIYWKSAIDFLFLKESVLIKGVSKLLEYLREDFHPSNVNTDHLLEKFNEKEEAAA